MLVETPVTALHRSTDFDFGHLLEKNRRGVSDGHDRLGEFLGRLHSTPSTDQILFVRSQKKSAGRVGAGLRDRFHYVFESEVVVKKLFRVDFDLKLPSFSADDHDLRDPGHS